MFNIFLNKHQHLLDCKNFSGHNFASSFGKFSNIISSNFANHSGMPSSIGYLE